MPLQILLDENLSPRIAHRLCELGFDVVAQRDRGLLGLKDWDLFSYCCDHAMAHCTKNVVDFEREASRCLARGEHHPGVLTIGDLPPDGVYWALRQLLEAEPDLDLRDRVRPVPPALASFVARREGR